MRAIKILKPGITLGRYWFEIQSFVNKKDFQLSEIFVVMELEDYFMRSQRFTLWKKKSRHENKRRNGFYY